MKHLVLTTIAAVVLVGCGDSQPTAKAPVLTIYEAARRGDIAAVKQRLAAGTKADTKTKDGTTPLHTAARFGHKGVAELLIAKGADVNAKNDGGETPLDGADGEIADLLRKHGGKSGAEFSIHFAAGAGDYNIEAIKQHLAAGTDVNAKDNNGSTPLHYAESEECVELLIAKGADINAKNERGETPLDTAKKLKRRHLIEVADFLRKRGAKTGEELKAGGK